MRELTLEDIDNLVLGATLLGTGGGGDPYIGRLMVRQAIADYGPIMLADPEDLDQDGLVLTTAVIGAPTVILEKVPAGTEFTGAVRALSNYLGKKPVAIMPIEAGGMNTIIPLATAAELGLPVIDADSMRRAFPQIEMTVFTLAGIGASPMSIADEKGNMVVFETTDNQMAERLARSTVIQLGLANAISCYPVTVAQVAKHGIVGSLSYGMELGRLLFAVQRGEPGAFDAFLEFSHGKKFFTGKVIDIDRRTTDGFAKGTIVIEHLDDPDRTMRVEVQNEFLMAFEDGAAVITSPDLICLLDHENGQPITGEMIAYGQRIDVIGLPCAPEWHQPGMLEVCGPRAFGYDVDYIPMEVAAK